MFSDIRASPSPNPNRQQEFQKPPKRQPLDQFENQIHKQVKSEEHKQAKENRRKQPEVKKVIMPGVDKMTSTIEEPTCFDYYYHLPLEEQNAQELDQLVKLREKSMIKIVQRIACADNPGLVPTSLPLKINSHIFAILDTPQPQMLFQIEFYDTKPTHAIYLEKEQLVRYQPKLLLEYLKKKCTLYLGEDLKFE